MADQANPNTPQDFEMGAEKTQQTPAPESAKPAMPSQATAASSVTPVATPKTNQPFVNKKALFGCVGAFGGLMLIFLLLSFIFLAQSGNEGNPIAKMLGVDAGVFVNSLITFIHIIFILSALVAFTFTMVGLFRASMAKKGDLIARKEGLRMTVVAGITLLVILIIWVFVYLWLDAKRVDVGGDTSTPILTEPAETLNLTAPIEIKFDAKNVSVDAGKYRIAAYEWDFDDGETGTGRVVSHVFKEKGNYEVKLSITVEDLATNKLLPGGEFSKAVTISDQALTAIIKADPQSGEAPLEVKFDASDSSDPDGNIERYDWDLDGDGEFDDSTEAEVTHKYEKVGKYRVQLRVTNTLGDYAVAEKEIIVQEAVNPEPVITVLNDPARFTPGVQYTFKADQSTSPNGKITKYEWDFGDGSKSVNTVTAVHSYTSIGTYEITLKVTDEKNEEGVLKKTIVIQNPEGTPKPVVSTQPEMASGTSKISGEAPLQVTFNASETTDSDNNIINYEWDYESDGKIDGYGEVVTHTFTQSGTYTVTLSVIDADQNIGKKTIVVEVSQQGISAVLTADKVEGSVPLTVSFDASGSSYPEGQITSYRWDFGDGTAASFGPASKTHKYTEIGTFTASVTVLGADSATDTSTLLITVREIPLQACFVSVFEQGPAPLNTTLDSGCSTGSIAKYFWDFGDGSTSTESKPNHTFQNPGTYNVTLEVSDSENNVSEADLTITVQ